MKTQKRLDPFALYTDDSEFTLHFETPRLPAVWGTPAAPDPAIHGSLCAMSRRRTVLMFHGPLLGLTNFCRPFGIEIEALAGAVFSYS